eukprot:4408538-Pleurochrysis_carterae.AAC.4
MGEEQSGWRVGKRRRARNEVGKGRSCLSTCGLLCDPTCMTSILFPKLPDALRGRPFAIAGAEGKLIDRRVLSTCEFGPFGPPRQSLSKLAAGAGAVVDCRPDDDKPDAGIAATPISQTTLPEPTPAPWAA